MNANDASRGLFAWLGSLFVALVLLNISIASGAELVTDSAVRLQVLRLVFPNTRISDVPTPKDDPPFPVTDPLGHLVISLKSGFEHYYEVVGPVATEEEEPASDITDLNKGFSDKRQVRMEVYRWKAPRDGEPLLAAVLDYSFAGANPARCCRAIGKVFLLSNAADRLLDSFDKMPNDFSMFTSVQFVDVDGSGTEKLLISADASGVAYLGVKSALFDLAKHRLTPLISVDTLVFYEEELENVTINTLTLDERQTIRSRGKRIFFVKETFAAKGKLFSKPRKSRVSFPVGYGLPLEWR